jgi:hypothetical protein
MPSNKHQTAKRQEALQKQQKEVLEHFRAYVRKQLIESPDITSNWLSADATFLRELKQYQDKHAAKFPSRVGDLTDAEARAPVDSAPELSNFIPSILSKSFTNNGVEPIVRVAGYQLIIGKAACGKKENVKRYKLTIFDKSNVMITAHTGTSLYYNIKRDIVDAGGQPYLRLKLFNHMHYKADKSDNYTAPGLVIVHYEFLASGLQRQVPNPDLKFGVCCPRAESEKVDDPTEASMPRPSDDPTEASFTSNSQLDLGEHFSSDFHRRVKEYQDNRDNEPMPTAEVEFCTPQNRLCSMHGVEYTTCLAESRPIEELNLDAIAEQCQYVDREVAEMPNNLKRNILYWWFATNFYQIVGLGERQQLPSCLVCAIRMAYPNEKGTPFVGFKSGSNPPKKRKS